MKSKARLRGDPANHRQRQDAHPAPAATSTALGRKAHGTIRSRRRRTAASGGGRPAAPAARRNGAEDSAGAPSRLRRRRRWHRGCGAGRRPGRRKGRSKRSRFMEQQPRRDARHWPLQALAQRQHGRCSGSAGQGERSPRYGRPHPSGGGTGAHAAGLLPGIALDSYAQRQRRIAERAGHADQITRFGAVAAQRAAGTAPSPSR